MSRRKRMLRGETTLYATAETSHMYWIRVFHSIFTIQKTKKREKRPSIYNRLPFTSMRTKFNSIYTALIGATSVLLDFFVHLKLHRRRKWRFFLLLPHFVFLFSSSFLVLIQHWVCTKEESGRCVSEEKKSNFHRWIKLRFPRRRQLLNVVTTAM